MVEDRDDRAAASARRPARAGAWKRASRRCGTRRSRWSRSATPGSRTITRRCVAAAEWLLGEEVTARGRLVGAPARSSRPAAGRSSSPTSTTPTSTTPPRSCSRSRALRRARSRCARRSTARSRRALRLGRGDAELRRRLGRVRRRQHARARARAAVPGLRRGDRRAERRRDRAHARDARRRSGSARRPPARRGVRWLLEHQEADGSWFGRWGINHVYGTGAAVPGADRRRGRAVAPVHPPGGRMAGEPPERRRRLGRGPALLRRPRVDRPRPEHRLADGLGAARAARRRRALAGARARRARGSWRPSARTAAGTSRSTPAPASRPTTTSTTTSTGSRSRSWRSGAAWRASARGRPSGRARRARQRAERQG